MASVGDVDSTTQLANSVLSCLEHVEPTVEMTTEDKIEVGGDWSMRHINMERETAAS